MERYRAGFDITILWAINDRNNAVMPLEDKDVHLYYTCERGRYEADITIQDRNVVVWHFYGKDQRYLGGYTLTLEINQSNGKRRIKKDLCDAFVLVGKDCEENYPEGDAIINNGGEITLSSELDIYRIAPIIPTVGENGNWYVDGVDTGKKSTGKSAYEIAVELGGYTGTEEEFAAALRENAEIKMIVLSEAEYEALPNKEEAFYFCYED